MCLCAYACVCVHICVFLCAYVCEFVFVCMCVWLACACLCAFVWLCVHLCAISTHPTHCIAFATNSSSHPRRGSRWVACSKKGNVLFKLLKNLCLSGWRSKQSRNQNAKQRICNLLAATTCKEMIKTNWRWKYFCTFLIKYKRMSPWLPGIGVIFSWAIVYFLKTVSPFI